ncbi:retrovirus-related Pol polyprotein from transposon 412 [Trichonephila clavipes]|nr:retrovirus-related Pol polyprotein from transposon 412 [Trichonephila clavipes]
MQLVLPRCRIDKVMKLAHESVYGGHMGVKKTKERIKYNFFWPNMSGEIAEFVQTCKGCQLRKPEKIGDRASITPIVRPELPFDIVNIDVIGRIQPPSGRGHKYVLCMMDQYTRWPEAVPLRSLTAETACDSLLQIFSRTGIPRIIANDQGTNFKSALIQGFTKSIGSSPRFSCPGYPASNGLVERCNKVLKDMIHHVIREDPRSWDRQLPFLLFAYREVSNTTTGVSPFRLLYGREARGPLAILKPSWPETKGAHGDYFNKRSSVKNFSIGEQVVLQIPDSSNKIYARWTGTGEIIQHQPPHSYKVKLLDGTVRHVHVNKIRKYHPRALAVGVIFEDDHEFGEIHPTPNLSRSTSERILHETDLNHLKEKSLNIKADEQIEELLRLDLIEESDAEIAYPIACVNKKNGTLRLCVDFRALNSERMSDDFPMEDAGYWAIPMAEDSKNLTSFKTHRQQYRFKRSAFDQVSEFDRGRIVAYRDCGLSFREIGSHVGRNQTTVMQICDHWMQEGTTDQRGRSHPPQCTLLSTRTIQRRLRQSGLSARCPLLFWSTLNAEPQTSPPPMVRERRMWTAEWNEGVFTDESRICLQLLSRMTVVA